MPLTSSSSLSRSVGRSQHGLLPVIFTWLLLLPAPVLAQSPGSFGPPDAARLDSEARVALRAGNPLRAAGLWEQAYQLKPSPDTQLLIGDAYAQVLDPKLLRSATVRALRAYRKFLLEEEQAQPEVRAYVLTAIRTLRQREGLESVEPSVPAPPPSPPLSMAPPPPPPPAGFVIQPPEPEAALTPAERARRRQRFSALGMLSVGVVLGAVGGALMAQAVSGADQAASADSYGDYLNQRGDARARLAGGITCLSVGGASALIGAILMVRSRAHRPAAAPAMASTWSPAGGSF